MSITFYYENSKVLKNYLLSKYLTMPAFYIDA